MVVDRENLKELIKELVAEVLEEEKVEKQESIFDGDIIISIDQVLHTQIEEMQGSLVELENNIKKHRDLIDKLDKVLYDEKVAEEVFDSMLNMFSEMLGYSSRELISFKLSNPQLNIISWLEDNIEVIN